MICAMPHTCTIQRRYQKQRLSYASGTAAFHTGATVSGGVSGATAVIDRIVGTAVSGYLVVKTVTGTFNGTETLTETVGATPHGSATMNAAQVAYKNDSGEYEYYWTDDQTVVPARFYTMRSRVTVLTPGQFPGMTPYVMLYSTATIDHLNYRIKSTTPGFLPASGIYQILSVKAPYNSMALDHYTLELKELASA
jgi:hypothetical protein